MSCEAAQSWVLKFKGWTDWLHRGGPLPSRKSEHQWGRPGFANLEQFFRSFKVSAAAICEMYTGRVKPCEAVRSRAFKFLKVGPSRCTEEGLSPSEKASTSGGDRVLHFWNHFIRSFKGPAAAIDEMYFVVRLSVRLSDCLSHSPTVRLSVRLSDCLSDFPTV